MLNSFASGALNLVHNPWATNNSFLQWSLRPKGLGRAHMAERFLHTSLVLNLSRDLVTCVLSPAQPGVIEINKLGARRAPLIPGLSFPKISDGRETSVLHPFAISLMQQVT
jgi:hypothetical protein